MRGSNIEAYLQRVASSARNMLQIKTSEPIIRMDMALFVGRACDEK